PPTPTLFPYTTLFRSLHAAAGRPARHDRPATRGAHPGRRVRRVGSVAALGDPVRLRGHHAVDAALPEARQRIPATRRTRLPGCADRKSTRLNSSHVKI